VCHAGDPLQAEVLIARPVDEVFSFVEDARNRPRWDASADSEELTSPEPIGVGTTVRTRLRSMGREYEYNWEVVEQQPPSRMTIESTSGPFPTTLDYRLSGHDRWRPRSGSCRPVTVAVW
jgi:uncharacterized protein YndB with AHSA1/START domain